MIYYKGSEENIVNYIQANNKKIILFGAGAVCRTYIPYMITKFNLLDRVLFIVDNNRNKQNSGICISEREIKICSIEEIKECREDFVIIITNGDFYPVTKQLDDISSCDNKVCFITSVTQLEKKNLYEKFKIFKDTEKPIIPQIIHYCWFSGKTIPKPLQRCIDSWKEMCPDYEFICWNEKTYDLKKYKYTYEAYKAEKWGFIPDIIRLDVLFEFGGFYFDTDVRLLKNLEELRYQEAFCSRERMGHVNFGGGSGCVKNSKIVKEILDFRKDVIFDLGNGNYNMEASGYFETEPLRRKGLLIEDVNQKLESINVYASSFFSPYNYINGENIQNKNTISIHYFNGSWIETAEDMRAITRDNYEQFVEGMKEI